MLYMLSLKKSALVNGGDLLKKANTHNQHMTYDKHIESYSDATWIVFFCFKICQYLCNYILLRTA